ncbi:hypothetical protein GGI04_000583 [Coemansia thaxteri]|uniref:WD40 repeat-like protein n=1 Tax=Coemansia thaxteri TaxID=2663907 RepID=A0A9W8BMZ0_9FUNG|nr:hypothetical protein H4R26_000870 [Coemansia thaxteri]KAJ2009280.1 hypothetical protein GGI04_000583 [Coemansia thaxteri]KAJ2472679.1 hypothetical protein GGI02_001415 [Coemansia sp. RSA 2322]KAJ2487153.1 hypothetical protein EV174_000695 [Coemansia sp. RSA 2320]
MSSAQLEALERREELDKDPIRQKLGSPLRTTARILDFELLGDDKVVLAQANYQAKVADLQAKECQKTAAKHAGPVTAVAVVADSYRVGGSRIALSASWDRTAKVWSVDGQQRTLAVLTGHTDFIKCLVAHPTLPIVYTGSADKTIMLWRLPESANELSGLEEPMEIRPFKVIKGQHTGQIYTLCLDGETGGVLFSAGSDASIRAWSAVDGTPWRVGGSSFDGGEWMVPRGQHKTNISDVKWTESVLWTASADNTAVAWELETGKVDLVLEHKTTVTAVLPIPQMGVVVTGVRDGVIYVWRINDGSPRIIREIHAHTDDVSCLKIAGRRFYSSGLDDTLREWDVASVVNFAGGLEYMPAELEALKRQADEQVQLAAATTGASKADGASALTEEEERELAELMSDIDDM